MIGLLIKKWFFTLWDNLIIVILCNFALNLVLSIVVVPFFTLGSDGYAVRIIIQIVGVILTYFVVGIINGFTNDMVKLQTFGFKDIPHHFRSNWLASLILALVQVGFFTVAQVAMKYYQDLDRIEGYLLMGVVFWIFVFWLMMASYFLPFNVQQNNTIKKLFKKSFYVFVDNIGFSFVVGLGSLIIMVLSMITLTMLPGIAGVILWNQVALKFRMYKYDYLENRPDEKSRKIPWKDLLIHEKDLIGPRTLRNMIFPWKD